MKSAAVTLTSQKRRQKFLRALFIVSFMIIPVLHFAVFYVYVNFSSFIMAFQQPEKGALVFSGFKNFKWVIDRIINGSTFEVDSLDIAFVNTFKTFGLNIVMFVCGLFVSYFIYKKIWGYKAFRILFYLPSIVSPVVVSIFYTEMVSASGFMPRLLEDIFQLDYDLVSPLTDPDFANKMVFLNIIWLHFPANLILWGGTFSRIPDSVIESARLDGCGWLREMFQIILPLVWPTFVLLITTQVAGIFGATGNVFLLTQGQNGTQTVSNWMYMRVQQTTNPLTSNNLYYVSAMGLMLTVVSCAIALFVRKFFNSRFEETQY